MMEREKKVTTNFRQNLNKTSIMIKLYYNFKNKTKKSGGIVLQSNKGLFI